ncbi:unnamed protein product [Dibothriocephalus latus]|uniref:Sodium/potassium-transporting ATPase subunit beta n=1 Tax=Dibothriocephalus latus TaxID=60516 RepID=A0A3P7LEG3_DIBLA|nr:unnamed protein product [Dibothriocephalus latus]
MSVKKYAQYVQLNVLPTLLKNGPDPKLLAFRVFNGPALRVHCQRLLYFIIFYALLAAFFFNYLNWLMYFQVSRDYPKLTGLHSALRMNPGLSFVPQPDLFNSLIRIRTTVPLPIYSLIDQVAAFLQSYQDNSGCTEMEDCVQEGGLTQDPERPCVYDLNAGGPCNLANGFGYDALQPCFALKMNKIYGWLPDPFSAIPPGKNPGNLDNGTFRSMYFPYRNQACYQQPLVFVQFIGMARYTLIRVKCHLIAKNIHVDLARREGSVSFEILAD